MDNENKAVELADAELRSVTGGGIRERGHSDQPSCYCSGLAAVEGTPDCAKLGNPSVSFPCCSGCVNPTKP